MSKSRLGDWQHSVDARAARAPGKRLRHRKTRELATVKVVGALDATLIMANGEERVVHCPELNDWQPEDGAPSCPFTTSALESAWLEPERIVARRPDGAPVTAAEMLAMIREGAPEALEFVQDLHGALLRILGVRSRSYSVIGEAEEEAEEAHGLLDVLGAPTGRTLCERIKALRLSGHRDEG